MGRFRKQKIGRMLNERHVLHLFVRMRDGRIGMASNTPRIHLRAGRVSALSADPRRVTHTENPAVHDEDK